MRDELINYIITKNEEYEKAVISIDNILYTERCTMNHQENTEYEKGYMDGLIKAKKLINDFFINV